jgi:hypothetical protein
MKKSEGKIQQEIVLWFNNNYCLKNSNPRCCIFSVPNEGKNAREQMYKKTLGMKTGVSDLILLLPNKAVFVEVKTDVGRQSDKQKEFEQIVTALGFEYWLVRSLEDFINKLQK